MSQYSHVFFDLDNTLTMSRTPINPAHQDILRRLAEAKDVIVVSGATPSRMTDQLGKEMEGKYYKLSQYGNVVITPKGAALWREEFSQKQTDEILTLINLIKTELNLKVRDENDLVEFRGPQISYSLIGHNENREKKYAFDPGSIKRKAILAKHTDKVKGLKEIGIDVTPGGTTTFDFILAGKHKGYNIARLIKELGWNKAEALYIGDEIAPGRNDETVIGVIDTQPIANPNETFAFVESSLL